MRRGLTLLETMISLGVLTVGMIGIVTLFQAGLGHSRRMQLRLRGSHQARVSLAERLTELDSLSAFGALADGSGPWQPVADAPDFQLRWVIGPRPLHSPGTHLEGAFPAAEQKTLNRSARWLEVQVRWPDGLGFASTSLGSAVIEPLRQWHPTNALTIQIAPYTSPLRRDRTLDLTARCLAADTLPLQDVTLLWSVLPIDGTGTLEAVARNGSQATFRHRTRRKNGTVTYSKNGSSCYVLVEATYAGETRTARSAPIQLGP